MEDFDWVDEGDEAKELGATVQHHHLAAMDSASVPTATSPKSIPSDIQDGSFSKKAPNMLSIFIGKMKDKRPRN